MMNTKMMELINFILKNKEIITSGKNLFNKNSLKIIKAIISGIVPDDLELTVEQKQLLIDVFVNKKRTFNENTPNYILENEECIKVSMSNDINSINYLKNISSELEEYIVSETIKMDFILSDNSPYFLKENYIVALNSIKKEPKTADFISWEILETEDINSLINELLQSEYVLSESSCEYLKSNKEIVLNSIKKDVNNIQYAYEFMKDEYDIFRYLLLNGYKFSPTYLSRKPLEYFTDFDMMCSCFNILNVYGDHCAEYVNKFNRVFNDVLNNPPTVKTLEPILNYIAEEEWEEYRNENFQDYENIFGKICTQLRNCSDFYTALKSLCFLHEAQTVLGNKYNDMYEAMLQYFYIFHSDTPDKITKVQPYQDVIAKYAALYVAKSKEDYKKDIISEIHDWLKPFFVLRIDHPIINKQVIQKQKKEKFKTLYKNGTDEDICKFINELVKRYNYDIIYDMINGFVIQEKSNLCDIISVPKGYRQYQKYEKASKLVNRLNSNYIKYDGIEMFKYKDIIKYNEEKQQYEYVGDYFDEDKINEYNDFRDKIRIFDKLKKDIVMKVKTLEIDENVSELVLCELSDELPLKDEYFKFDEDYLKDFEIIDLINCCTINYTGYEVNSFTSNESYEILYNLLVNNNVIWILLFMSIHINYNTLLDRNGIKKEDIRDLVNNMYNISKLSKDFSFDTKNVRSLFLLNELCKYTNSISIAVLGFDLLEKLYIDRQYTCSGPEKIIIMAEELVVQMVKRSKSTVPFVNGKTINYKYCTYDSQDETLLSSGIDTDSCFRIDGNDHDFLHYCALDKNGFAIKITDYFGKFIGRAAGFRNGNCVYINQLRTIYDSGGNTYTGTCENERNDIIETLKQACQDIVGISQNNANEVDKIEYVFITKSYSMKNCKSNVPEVVFSKIGDNPMDNESEDWNNFINNCQNLEKCSYYGYFETDYGAYDLICLASSKKKHKLKSRDIKPKDVEAVYERTRSSIIVTDTPDMSVFKKISKINGIYAYLNYETLKSTEIPTDSIIFLGDNWYIIYTHCINGNYMDYTVLDFDEKAIIEFEATKKVLDDYSLSNDNQLNISQITDTLKQQPLDNKVKILKPNS